MSQEKCETCGGWKFIPDKKGHSLTVDCPTCKGTGVTGKAGAAPPPEVGSTGEREGAGEEIVCPTCSTTVRVLYTRKDVPAYEFHRTARGLVCEKAGFLVHPTSEAPADAEAAFEAWWAVTAHTPFIGPGIKELHQTTFMAGWAARGGK